MRILLQVHGEERSYSELELIQALERLEDLKGNTKTTEIVQKTSRPMVGKWFTVKLADIDWNFVEKSCRNAGADYLWKDIDWARSQIPTNHKYQGEIQTLVPAKNWEWKTEKQLREMAKELGNEMVDEVIFYLELAQRIYNGEPVNTLTEKADHLYFYRLIITRSGGTGFVGGVSACNLRVPPAVVYRFLYYLYYKFELFYTVPAVARFNKH
ncbi:MAG: hypothetical protein FWF46_04705 [Oscillospiraceae bacterium]|nr:hypothetical protein [Oscillospiraceae bacterium]